METVHGLVVLAMLYLTGQSFHLLPGKKCPVFFER
jgi:hypothetical protein